MNFTPEDLLPALGIMGKGLLGIFVVVGAIILTVALLNKLTNRA